MSNSGGTWGDDGRLYATGHDEGEVFALSLPTAGSVLELQEPVTLHAVAVYDGKPTRRPMPSGLVGQRHFVPNSATGLRLSWYRYRGPGPVTFDPPQTKVWQDRRDGGNSPWSAGWQPPPIPPDSRWTVRATFSEPGTYVLRALASDGGLVDHGDVTITVTR